MTIGIAYMLNQFEDGGAERQLIELIRRVDRDRFQPVLYLGSSNGRIAKELPKLGIPIRYVRGAGGGKLAWASLVRELRRQQPEIIHAWQFVANTWGRVAGRIAGVPAIITSDRGMDSEIKPVYRWLDTALAPLSDRVIVNARAVADNVHRTRHVPRSKIVTIYNGVDLDCYSTPMTREEVRRQMLDLPLDLPVIGMIASFCTRKRWDLFLQAVAEVARHRTLLALCVGDGELRPHMEEYARELGLAGSVRFLGLRSDIAEIVAAQNVSVLSSDDEGMPNVVMQAMVGRRPVVATDAGGTAELISEGETGFVVPRGDAAGLAHRIGLLLDDAAMAARFGEAGRRRVERYFTFDACVNDTVAVYEGLLARRKKTRSVRHAA